MEAQSAKTSSNEQASSNTQVQDSQPSGRDTQARDTTSATATTSPEISQFERDINAILWQQAGQGFNQTQSAQVASAPSPPPFREAVKNPNLLTLPNFEETMAQTQDGGVMLGMWSQPSNTSELWQRISPAFPHQNGPQWRGGQD